MYNCSQEQGYSISHAGGFFAGVLMGGLIGAGAMLFLAPQSGKKTRNQIQREGLELRGQVVEAVEGVVRQARGQAHRLAARAHKQTKKLQQRGQDMLDEQIEVVLQAIDAEKSAVHNIVKG